MRGFWCTLFLAILLTGRAHAATQFCSAQADFLVPIHDLHSKSGLGTDTEFAIALGAFLPSTVTGVVEIYADGSIYEVPFANTPIVAEKQAWLDSNGKHVLDFSAYRSPPLYFAFPGAHTVQAVWVDKAGTDALSVRNCPTIPIAVDPDSEKHKLEWRLQSEVSVEKIREEAPAKPPLAQLKGALDVGTCTTLFTEATATSLVTPNYPDSQRETGFGNRVVIIKLALASDAKVADAWIFGSSGLSDMDANALRAARASTYAPAKFLCIPVPGYYLFRANFNV